MAERSRRKQPIRQSGRTEQLPQFVSYHASRRAVQSEQSSRLSNAPMRLPRFSWFKRKWINMWTIAGLLVVGCIGYSLTLVPSARLTITNSRGVPMLRERQQYQQSINQILSSSILRRNKLTIDIQKISSELEKKFPELSSVTVTLPFMGHRPIVEITTARPALYLNSGNNTYIVNTDGQAVMNTRQLSNKVGTLTIPTVKDASGLSVSAGKSVLTHDDVKFITTIYSQFAAKSVTIDSFELPPIPAELHVRVANEALLKCNMFTDARVIAGQYLAYRDSAPAQKSPAKEYIDLRVEGKVFVK